MKKLYFILLLISQFCNSQKTKLVVSSPKVINTSLKTELIKFDCESGEKLAKVDFENGNYNVYSYGLVFLPKNRNKFDSLQKKFLKEKYSINFQHRGCVILPSSKCYSKKMNELIEKKFGVGFIDKIFEESRNMISIE